MVLPSFARETRQLFIIVVVAAAWLLLTVCPPHVSSRGHEDGLGLAVAVAVATAAVAAAGPAGRAGTSAIFDIEGPFVDREVLNVTKMSTSVPPVQVDAMAAAFLLGKLPADNQENEKLQQQQPQSAHSHDQALGCSPPAPFASLGKQGLLQQPQGRPEPDWSCPTATEQLTGWRQEGDAANMATLFVAGVLTKCMSRFLTSNQIVWMAAA